MTNNEVHQCYSLPNTDARNVKREREKNRNNNKQEREKEERQERLRPYVVS